MNVYYREWVEVDTFIKGGRYVGNITNKQNESIRVWTDGDNEIPVFLSSCSPNEMTGIADAKKM